ncbi:Dps family protein [Scatolibacter rhodanostii]|uniref:Dps family protein n=1 Tax=Scatolibacter rhodanostii TaxID=2014781 RepID=UPI000C08B7FE|nr:DNA starvation/stationary phase protection protein [Scatolibacter rhodanostii]
MPQDLQDKMNLYLANQEIMYIKLHNLHWYIQGKGFFTLHAKLEELYDQTAEVIDEVAERLLAISGKPIANLKNALAIATVKELEDEPVSSDSVVYKLISDVEYWIQDSAEIIKLAEDADDVGTADLFTGYLANYQKLLWMLRAYTSS